MQNQDLNPRLHPMAFCSGAQRPPAGHTMCGMVGWRAWSREGPLALVGEADAALQVCSFVSGTGTEFQLPVAPLAGCPVPVAT